MSSERAVTPRSPPAPRSRCRRSASLRPAFGNRSFESMRRLDDVRRAGVRCCSVPTCCPRCHSVGARWLAVKGRPMAKPIISADSHITEAPGTYVDRIDHRFRDRAPKVVRDATRGDLFVIDGLDKPIPIGLIAAAGKAAEDLRMFGGRIEDMHPGGFDPEARLAEQDTDGVSAEVLYPSVGMMLCNHPDFDYKKACFDAYNRWIAEYCGAHPDRLIGVGQTAMRSVEEGIEDLS